MTKNKTEIFNSAPIPKAVLFLVIPTVISKLVTVLYNMADTFFIGQLGDPAQIAAMIVATPAFFMLTGFTNLFGIGGSSLIARNLGKGNVVEAKKTARLSILGGILTALIYPTFPKSITMVELFPRKGIAPSVFLLLHQ